MLYSSNLHGNDPDDITMCRMSSSHLEMSKMISACACCNLPIWKCPRSYPHCEVLSFPSVSILDESGSEQDASALVGCVFPILKSPRYHPRDVHRLCLNPCEHVLLFSSGGEQDYICAIGMCSSFLETSKKSSAYTYSVLPI